MAQTSVNIRMDEELKKKFEEFCNEIGMSMTTAICIFAKKAVREQKIPFEVSAEDPFYSSVNIKRLEKAIAAINAGSGKTPELVEVDSE